MAKYLRTSGISAGIEELIREAKERLYIISPYLKLSDNIKDLLNDKEREKVEVRFIFRHRTVKIKDNQWQSKNLRNVKSIILYKIRLV